ncbi:MAG: hypothetical protein HQL86_01175 [Magnetococcales bacterium]|nr:hypothetical protein [Magnetococcales bacterium]
MIVQRFFFHVGVVVALMLSTMDVQASERSHWQTDFGPVKLRVEGDGRVTGSYPDYQGSLEGELLDHHQLDLYWFQPRSDVRCNHSRGGTHYWGRVYFRIVGGERLSGEWSYCDRRAGSGGKWNGYLTSGVAPGREGRHRGPGYGDR